MSSLLRRTLKKGGGTGYMVDLQCVAAVNSPLALRRDSFVRLPAPRNLAETRRPRLEPRPHVPVQHKSSSGMSDKARMDWSVGDAVNPAVTTRDVQQSTGCYKSFLRKPFLLSVRILVDIRGQCRQL